MRLCTYLPTENAAQSHLINRVVDGLESYYFDVSRTKISLAEMWEQDCPDGPEHVDFKEYLELVRYHYFPYDGF